jgi:hypothetical protein
MGRWRSLACWITRRDPAGAGEVAFSHAGGIAAFFWVVMACVASELVVVELLMPWARVRLVSTGLHLTVLLLLLTAYASLRMHPHLVVPEGLVLSTGPTTRLMLPWRNVVSLDRGTHGPQGGRISMEVNGMTNLLVTLDPPMRWKDQSVSSVRFYADRPADLLAAAGPPLTAAPGETSRRGSLPPSAP